MKKLLAVLILLPLLLSIAYAQGGIVKNPDFEDGFRDVGAGEVTVADEWYPWWDETKKRPEYKPETRDVGKGRVYHGEYAQKWFTTYASHDAGIYQQVAVEEGKWYEFSAWVYVWSSDENDPDKSTKDGDYRALVGINPWGDCRALYRTTVWGRETYHVYNEWAHVSVIAQAWSDSVCVFTRGVAIWPRRHMDSYWDLVDLREVSIGQPCPTPQPCPSNGDCPSIDEIRYVVREELDKTTLGH